MKLSVHRLKDEHFFLITDCNVFFEEIPFAGAFRVWIKYRSDFSHHSIDFLINDDHEENFSSIEWKELSSESKLHASIPGYEYTTALTIIMVENWGRKRWMSFLVKFLNSGVGLIHIKSSKHIYLHSLHSIISIIPTCHKTFGVLFIHTYKILSSV